MRPMPIIRSRTGCFTCRRRKKKCNEEKPICSGCKRNKLECHWPAESSNSSNSQKRDAAAPGSGVNPPQSSRLSFATSMSSESQQHPHPVQDDQQRQRREAPQPQLQFALDPELQLSPEPTIVVSGPSLAPPSQIHIPGDGSSTPGPGSEDTDMADDEAGQQSPSPSPSPSSTHSSANSSDAMSVAPPVIEYDHELVDALALTIASGSNTEPQPFLAAGIPMPIPMLPHQHGHDSYELLSYYLARTANSMGNGSTDVNPFIAKLIPLGFSNPLVLQLILAQSAAHRQASAERQPTDQIAQRYYTDSLRMFRNVVSEYVSGKEENTLVLTVGSLILCLTEVARGDIHGTVFDHLSASKSLLSMLLARPKSELFDDLPDFLVEYYMHIAASSMISIDAHYSSESLLSPDIENMARGLVERKYVGQLCGCWLELLVLIPQIFHLGQGMMTTVDGQPASPSPDKIVTFGFLQSQTLAFFPDVAVTPHARLAGLVFKQAVLLYLWTILGTSYVQREQTVHKALMDSAVSDAVALLSQLPATVRVNTSLCWPLAVIGCSTTDPNIQQILRLRLQTMVDTIGLGNMRETLVLLEHVWRQPLEDISPWTLCKAMRDHQIWISFA
ncbi:fungal-specific transcription factor domain-containing protein [Dactylonectria macrodidyma]|uniref:Fungal-specific transcription factor domain-containing protein n=1 Tax=Dactylonectria macrodidyma TaxID=307937 RepID=A0A9P9JN63_9HYPO|nr:fungal-specific transcription factor domain-containing protein [Dactylonectria macrodidyma]